LLEPWREKDAPPPVLEWRVCGCLVLARCGSNAKQFLRVLGFAIQQYAVVKSLSLLVLLAAVHLLGPETSLRPVLVLTKAASLTSLVSDSFLSNFSFLCKYAHFPLLSLCLQSPGSLYELACLITFDTKD